MTYPCSFHSSLISIKVWHILADLQLSTKVLNTPFVSISFTMRRHDFVRIADIRQSTSLVSPASFLLNIEKRWVFSGRWWHHLRRKSEMRLELTPYRLVLHTLNLLREWERKKSLDLSNLEKFSLPPEWGTNVDIKRKGSNCCVSQVIFSTRI